jgi:hypothetical protein
MSDTTSHPIITVTLHENPSGTHTASAIWEGQEFSEMAVGGSIFALCRALVDAGCPDLQWVVPGRISGKVHACAVRAIAENPTCRSVPFEPHEKSAPRPLLQPMLDRAAASRWLARMRKTKPATATI